MVAARAKVPVHSGLTAVAGTTYLLQATGEAQVGGAGHMVDGISRLQARRTRSRRRWGSFGLDHSRRMLYTGAGRRTALNHHDTGGKSRGYKNDAGFLPVNIWAIP
jgi:hypothetical protein